MATTASNLAKELRMWADCLDKGGDVAIERAYVTLLHYSADKERFLSLVPLIPRPLKKSYTDLNVECTFHGEALTVIVHAPRTVACRLVTPAQPAVYDCESLLSEAEDAAVA